VILTRADVQDILRLVDDLQVDRLHLRLNKFELTLRRGEDGEWTQSARTSAEPVLVDAPTAPEDETREAPPDEREGLVEVRTSLPGTFYRAPKPGAPPFVEIGTEVTRTTVVGIVETMKLMNSVYAGVAGTVAEIRLRDGEFAEQGAVLMYVEPEPE
jgi:acetyl-CoA carboxylase biotin carboxyl carrier protein